MDYRMGKLVTCGYCKRKSIPLDSSGNVSTHTIATSNITECRGMETYLRLDAMTGRVRDRHE